MRKLKNLAKISLITFLLVFSLSVVVAPVQAQLAPDLQDDVTGELDIAVTDVYNKDTDQSLPEIVGNTIKLILQFLGVILLVLVIYGGFLWMTSAGDEEKITKAKKIITSAVVGVLIVVLAYVITHFVMTTVVSVVTTGAES